MSLTMAVDRASNAVPWRKVCFLESDIKCSFAKTVNCCLKYKLFVGRGHDPADHLGQLSGKNASKMCKLLEIRYSSVSLRCGGVMMYSVVT